MAEDNEATTLVGLFQEGLNLGTGSTAVMFDDGANTVSITYQQLQSTADQVKGFPLSDVSFKR